MGSRSRSRSRERDRRPRSRSPRSRSHKEDRRGENKPFIKKEHTIEHDRRKEVPAKIKTEPRDDDKRGKFKKDDEPVAEPEKPSFALSGKLMEDTNVYNGVVIKYSEPEEARKPKRRWRFYVFKGDESLPVMHIHRQSAYLIGKDRKIADIPVDHPSCSRQHAVLQYRAVKNKVLPYIIDLGSSNGTYLNNQKIDPQRYVELREKDVVKFGYSSREYVLLHENSDD